MLIIACVQVDNYCGRGAEYVAKLFRGVRRNLSTGWQGVCLTDDVRTVPEGIDAIALPEILPGWWNKLQLFRPGILPKGDRVLYFDLDTVIVGSLDDLGAYRGAFACMDNPYAEGPATGIMAWEAGSADHIWTLWEKNWRPMVPEGDQQWVRYVARNCERLNRILPGQLVSYKADVLKLGCVPDSARAIYFHGTPRPHEIDEPWMDQWNNGD